MAAGRWKAFIPILLALVIAAGGSYFLYNWLQQRTAAPDVARKVEVETFPVAVAAVDLPWGTKIDNPEMITTVPYLKDSRPDGHFSDPAKLMGRVVLSPIKASEPVLEYRLASSDIKSGGISAVVKQGMRAVAVAGNKVSGIAGFINPGNRVDVMVTTQDPETDEETTKLVLEKVLVLATGTQVQENAEGKPSPVDVYTLEVTPFQAEQLSLIASAGKLQFALRNITDAEEIRTQGATITQTLNSLTAPAKAAPVAKQRVYAPTSATVEVIRGSAISKEKVQL
jgi:pilus assembly protein CpaB